MVDKTLFLLVVLVDPDLMVGVGWVDEFEERVCTWVEEIFFRNIVE